MVALFFNARRPQWLIASPRHVVDFTAGVARMLAERGGLAQRPEDLN